MDKLKKYGLLLLLVVLSGFLRFYNLGYSEFQDDEKKAFIRKDSETTTYQFFMNQRKGPMQFFVTSATMVLNNDPRNEFVIRLPFTIFNILSVVVFYYILMEFFDSKVVSFFGGLLFAINGFTVGFSRIAQYQNLNIFFSLISFYLFIKLSKAEHNHLKISLFGTAAFCISLLSHWDAIFFLVPIAYYYLRFLLNKDIDIKLRKKVTLYSFVAGCLILLPFLIPYTISQMNNQSNIEYFDRRLGISDYSWVKHKFIYELYNPYISMYFLAFLAYLGLFRGRKTLLFAGWFLVNFLLIRVFMEKPGTHIYNYVIPFIFISITGISFLYKHKDVFIALLLPLSIFIGFLYYQSYIVFVEHNREYPWDENEILKLKNISFITKQYEEKEVLTFGFPHFRNWKKVNEIVSGDPENCTYISNEGKEITQIYMDNKFGLFDTRTCYYIVEVKRPFITAGDGAVFAKTRGKDPIYEYERNGETLLKLYKISTN